ATVARAERVTEREKAVRERERELERAARGDARRYLLDARHEIEKTIRELRAAGAEQIEAAAVEARRAVERRAAEAGRELAALDSVPDAGEPEAERTTTEDRGPKSETAGGIEVGSPVAVATLEGKAGLVVELRGRDAVVAVGAMKLTVPIKTLKRVSKRELEPLEVAVPLIGDQPDVEVRHEVDLRGMRVDEMEVALTQAVDAAVRADLAALRIIHGKGTGALRERVGELLSSDPRVRTFRMGGWNEGGAGVTIAELS
ncbi:MAG TPA: Smr/MutS family protein, partial [Gemmatimonadaceae bacterium]|nr:Smr/MutS family protein [Gemmatimonadaceae bacterium]